MKLNNRGWGLGIFLVFVMIFVLCIIVAGVNAYKIGLQKEPSIQFGSDSGKSNYEKYKPLEDKIKLAAEEYKNVHYTDMSFGDSVFVTFKTLVANNHLSSSEGCTGYVKISDGDEYIVYFNCPDYKSSGYLEDLDK